MCGDTIQPLRVIIPKIDKYFNNSGEKKYNEIWEVIRNLLKKDFTIIPVQDDIYLISKFRIFNRILRTIYDSIFIHMGKFAFAFQ